MADAAALEAILGYTFKDKRLAVEALTHSSLLNEPQGTGRTSNERLAFVGDAVIYLVVAEHLAQSKHNRGELTKDRIRSIKNEALGRMGVTDEIARLLDTGNSRPDSVHLRADLYEAVIAAVFWDAGYNEARRVALQHIHPAA